ncbi:MAG TPA: RDD family protein [Pyrinomonadaceae bacterium]|nr:RDD family protein [Pyrinomonadaceae bacterium]
MTENPNVTTRTTQEQNNSTLIEFPGVNRNRPAWRKELSERFREIQQRRAREADTQGEAAKHRQAATPARNASNASDAARADAPAQAADSASKQLGLVPTPDEPELNPIVAKALRRIERARAAAASAAPRQGGGRGHAATAAARVFEEEVLPASEPAAAPQPERTPDAGSAQAKRPARRAEKVEKDGDAARPSPLVVVQPKQAEQPKPEVRAEAASEAAAAADAKAITEAKAPARATARTVVTPEAASAAETLKQTAETLKPTPAAKDSAAEALKKSDTPQVAEPVAQPSAAAQPSAEAAQANNASRQPRHIAGVLDEFWLERQGIELLPKVEAPELSYDDRAPRLKRIAAGLVDLFAVAFLSAPFAAGIELTISNWNDPRVSGSMALIAALVMFLYETCSVALAGRTFGMSLCGLHAVDARKASVPTTGQCMRRAVLYMLSLATFGLGLLYSLFDAEGRAVHDILSGTVVVRK